MDGRTTQWATAASILGVSRFLRTWRWDKIPLRIRRLAGYEVVRAILGLVLLTAAGLKGYQLATEPTLERGLLTSRWFLIAQVEFELFLGVFLLCGLYKRLVWLVTLICFIGFSCVTSYKALTGEVSCGCFGRVEVSPWHTLAFDACAILALLTFRPTGICQSTRRNSHIRPAYVCIAVLTFGICAGLAMVGVTPDSIGPLIRSFGGYGPSIKFDSLLYDFKEVYMSDEPVNCEFAFHNRGNEELVISRIAPECGCTVPAISKSKYVPGEKGVVRVQVDVRGQPRHLDKGLTVWTNDPMRPYIKLRVQGLVRKPLSLSPYSIAFGPLKPGQCQSKSLTIIADTSEKVPSIDHISCDLLDVKVDMEEASGNPSERTLKVTATGRRGPGQEAGNVSIDLSHASVKRLSIPVSIEHTGPFQLVPSYLFLGNVGRDHSCERDISISSHGGEPFRVISAQTAGPWKMSLRPSLPVQGKSAYKLWIRLACREPPAGLLKGRIRLVTDSKDQPTVEIIVSGVRSED